MSDIVQKPGASAGGGGGVGGGGLPLGAGVAGMWGSAVPTSGSRVRRGLSPGGWRLASRREASGLPGPARGRTDFGGAVWAELSTRPCCAACRLKGLGESLRAYGDGVACLRRFETVERSAMEARAGGEVHWLALEWSGVELA